MESSVGGDDSIEDEVDDRRAEEIRKYGKYLLPSVGGYESDTSVVLVFDKLEFQSPTLTDEENYAEEKKPAKSSEVEKLDPRTVTPLETKSVLDVVVLDANEGEPSTQQVTNVTQFNGERTLVNKVPVEEEKPLVVTSRSDYTSVSLKDLIPEEEITAAQRVNELKVDISTNPSTQEDGDFLDRNKELQSLSRSPVDEENMEVFSNSKDNDIDFSNLPQDEIPHKDDQGDVTGLPTKDKLISTPGYITTQYTNTLHQKEVEQDSDGDNDLRDFAIQIQNDEKITFSNIEEEVHVIEKAAPSPVVKENPSSRSSPMTEEDTLINHEVVQEPDYQAFSHEIESSINVTDASISLGERPDNLDVSSKQDIAKSFDATEHRDVDGTAYETDRTSSLFIADKEEVDEIAIEVVQVQESQFQPFSFDALDERPLDQINEMKNELNFMIEPRVDFRVEHIDDEHVEDKPGDGDYEHVEDETGDVADVTSPHENDEVIQGYPNEFLSSSKPEKTFSIAQLEKEIIKTNVDRLHSEPNMDEEEVSSKDNKTLQLINGQHAGEKLNDLRSENLTSKDTENQKINIEDDANVIFTSVHQRVSEFEDERKRQETSKLVLSPRMSVEEKKTEDVPPAVTEEHLTKLRFYGNMVMPSEDLETSDMIIEKLPVTIESSNEEMNGEKEEENTAELEYGENIQAIDTSANETEKDLTNITEKELQGSAEREIDKDKQTQKYISVGSIPFLPVVQDIARDESVLTRSDEKDESVISNVDISTNDGVTYQQIVLLKPLETVELSSSSTQPVRDSIDGEDIKNDMVNDAAIKPSVDMEDDIGDAIVDADMPIEIRATEINVEQDQIDSNKSAPAMSEIDPNNVKLEASKGFETDMEKNVSEQEFIEFEETAPIVPQVLREELESEEGDSMSTKGDANQRPIENQTEAMDHGANNMLKEAQVTAFVSSEDIEKYRQAGKMVLPGNDDIDQLIIEIAPKDIENEDSSKGNEVVETKSVQGKEENSDGETDGEKEGDNKAEWKVVENIQAIGLSATETSIDITEQELQGSIEKEINKDEQMQNSISVDSIPFHPAVQDIASDESVVTGSLVKDESVISNAAMSTSDDLTYQQIKLLKPLETVELSSISTQRIRDNIDGKATESIMVNDTAIKPPADMQDDTGDIIVDASKSSETRTTESNFVKKVGIEFEESSPVTSEIDCDNAKTNFSKGVQTDIEKNVSEQESIEFEETSPCIPQVLREETESEEADCMSAKTVLNQRPIENQAEIMNHQKNLLKEAQVITFVSAEDIEKYIQAGKVVLPGNDEIDQMIIEIVPKGEEIGDSSKESESESENVGIKSVQGKSKVRPIINKDNETLKPLLSKEMVDSSYLKPYTLPQRGTTYNGKNGDVEDVTDTVELQTLVDETNHIQGKDASSGERDKRQTMEDFLEPKHVEFQETTPDILTEVENEIVANGEKVDPTESLEIDMEKIISEQECIELIETKLIIPMLVQEKTDTETKRDSADILQQKTILPKEAQAMSFVSDEDIEKYREVGKMVLLGRDDVDQMIIESALPENEVMDSLVVDKRLGTDSTQQKDLNPLTLSKTENISFDNESSASVEIGKNRAPSSDINLPIFPLRKNSLELSEPYIVKNNIEKQQTFESGVSDENLPLHPNINKIGAIRENIEKDTKPEEVIKEVHGERDRVLLSSLEDSNIPGGQSSEVNRDSVSQIVENNVKMKMTHAGVLQYSVSTEQREKLSRILKKPEFANTNIASKDKFYPKDTRMNEKMALIKNTAEEATPPHKQAETPPADSWKHEGSLFMETSESAELDINIGLNKPKENSTNETKKVSDAPQILEALDSKKISEDEYNTHQNSYETPLPDNLQIKVIADVDLETSQNVNEIENEESIFETYLNPDESNVNLPGLAPVPIQKDNDSIIRHERMTLRNLETAKVGPTGVDIFTEGPMEKELREEPPKTKPEREGEHSADMEANQIVSPVVRPDTVEQEHKTKAVDIPSQEVDNISDITLPDVHNIHEVSSDDTQIEAILNLRDLAPDEKKNIVVISYEGKEEVHFKPETGPHKIQSDVDFREPEVKNIIRSVKVKPLIWHENFEPEEEKREWTKPTEYIQEPSIKVERTEDSEIQPMNPEVDTGDAESEKRREYEQIGKESKETLNLPPRNLTHLQVISASQDGEIPEYIESKSPTNKQTTDFAKKFEQLGRKSSKGLKPKDINEEVDDVDFKRMDVEKARSLLFTVHSNQPGKPSQQILTDPVMEEIVPEHTDSIKYEIPPDLQQPSSEQTKDSKRSRKDSNEPIFSIVQPIEVTFDDSFDIDEKDHNKEDVPKDKEISNLHPDVERIPAKESIHDDISLEKALITSKSIASSLEKEVLSASEPYDDSVIEVGVIVADGNRDGFVLEKTFSTNLPVLENELTDANENVDDSLGDKTNIFEKKNEHDSPSNREGLSLPKFRKNMKIVKAVSVERTNQLLTTTVPNKDKEFSVATKEVLVQENDMADSISVQSDLPSVSSLENDVVKMKEADRGYDLEDVDRLDSNEDQEFAKIRDQKEELFFSGKQLIISKENLEEQTLQKEATPSKNFSLKKEVIDANQNVDDPLLDKQMIVEKDNVPDSTPKKEAVPSSVTRKSTKIVKSVSIEKENQLLTMKLPREAKDISTAMTEVPGEESNFRNDLLLQSDAMLLPSNERVEETETEERRIRSEDAETVMDDESQEIKEMDSRDESLIHSASLYPGAGLSQETLQGNEEHKHILSETQLHIKDKNEYKFIVDIGPSKIGENRANTENEIPMEHTTERYFSSTYIEKSPQPKDYNIDLLRQIKSKILAENSEQQETDTASLTKHTPHPTGEMKEIANERVITEVTAVVTSDTKQLLDVRKSIETKKLKIKEGDPLDKEQGKEILPRLKLVNRYSSKGVTMTHSIEQRKDIEDSPNSRNNSFSNHVKSATDSKLSGKGDSDVSPAEMINASVAEETIPTSSAVVAEIAPVEKEAYMRAKYIPNYEFNNAIMVDGTRDGGKEQTSENSKDLQSSDLDVNLKSSSDESSLVNIEGHAASEEGQPLVSAIPANQESAEETLPRMKFITRHSTQRIEPKLSETASNDLDENESDLVKNEPERDSDNVKEELDSDNLLEIQIPKEPISVTNMMVKSTENEKGPQNMSSVTISFKAAPATESDDIDGSTTSETHELLTKVKTRNKDTEIMTVNEETITISTANNDEHLPVREELLERLSEAHKESQPLGDNKVEEDKLTERETSPSFKPVTLPTDLENEESAGTVGIYFHGDLVVETEFSEVVSNNVYPKFAVERKFVESNQSEEKAEVDANIMRSAQPEQFEEVSNDKEIENRSPICVTEEKRISATDKRISSQPKEYDIDMLRLGEDYETDILRQINTQVLVENESDEIAATLVKRDETEEKGKTGDQQTPLKADTVSDMSTQIPKLSAVFNVGVKEKDNLIVEEEAVDSSLVKGDEHVPEGQQLLENIPNNSEEPKSLNDYEDAVTALEVSTQFKPMKVTIDLEKHNIDASVLSQQPETDVKLEEKPHTEKRTLETSPPGHVTLLDTHIPVLDEPGGNVSQLDPPEDIPMSLSPQPTDYNANLLQKIKVEILVEEQSNSEIYANSMSSERFPQPTNIQHAVSITTTEEKALVSNVSFDSLVANEDTGAEHAKENEERTINEVVAVLSTVTKTEAEKEKQASGNDVTISPHPNDCNSDLLHKVKVNILAKGNNEDEISTENTTDIATPAETVNKLISIPQEFPAHKKPFEEKEDELLPKIKFVNRYSTKRVILMEEELNKNTSIKSDKLVTVSTKEFDVNLTSKETEISSNPLETVAKEEDLPQLDLIAEMDDTQQVKILDGENEIITISHDENPVDNETITPHAPTELSSSPLGITIDTDALPEIDVITERKENQLEENPYAESELLATPSDQDADIFIGNKGTVATSNFSELEPEREELPELDVIAEKTEKLLEEIPCVENVSLTDGDTDILVASKGTEMTSSYSEVEVELDQLLEPDLMAKKEETQPLTNQNTPETPKVSHVKRYSTKRTAKDVSGDKSEGIPQTDKSDGQVKKAEVNDEFGNEVVPSTPPSNMDPEIVKKLPLLMTGSEKSYTLEKTTEFTVMGFGQDDGEILSTYSSESDANSEAMYDIVNGKIERRENFLTEYVPPEGQKYPPRVDPIKLFKSHENVTSSAGGALPAGPKMKNVENETSFLVEKECSESFEEKNSLKSEETQRGFVSEVNFRNQQDSEKQKESSYAVKITLASTKIENENETTEEITARNQNETGALLPGQTTSNNNEIVVKPKLKKKQHKDVLQLFEKRGSYKSPKMLSEDIPLASYSAVVEANVAVKEEIEQHVLADPVIEEGETPTDIVDGEPKLDDVSLPRASSFTRTSVRSRKVEAGLNENTPRELVFRQIQEKDSEEQVVRKELDDLMGLPSSQIKATANEFTKESRAIEVVQQNGENGNVEGIQLPHVYSVKGKSTKKMNEVYELETDSMALQQLVSERASTISTPSSISSTTLSETDSEKLGFRAKESINQQDLVADKQDVKSGHVENDITVLSINNTQQIEQADVLDEHVLEEEPDGQLWGKLSKDVTDERVVLPQELPKESSISSSRGAVGDSPPIPPRTTSLLRDLTPSDKVGDRRGSLYDDPQELDRKFVLYSQDHVNDEVVYEQPSNADVPDLSNTYTAGPSQSGTVINFTYNYDKSNKSEAEPDVDRPQKVIEVPYLARGKQKLPPYQVSAIASVDPNNIETESIHPDETEKLGTPDFIAILQGSQRRKENLELIWETQSSVTVESDDKAAYLTGAEIHREIEWPVTVESSNQRRMNSNEVSVYHPLNEDVSIMDTLNDSLGPQQRPKELRIQYKADEERTDQERMFTVGKWVSNVRIPKDGESSVYSSSNPASPSSPKELLVPWYSPTSLDVFWRSNIEKNSLRKTQSMKVTRPEIQTMFQAPRSSSLDRKLIGPHNEFRKRLLFRENAKFLRPGSFVLADDSDGSGSSDGDEFSEDVLHAWLDESVIPLSLSTSNIRRSHTLHISQQDNSLQRLAPLKSRDSITVKPGRVASWIVSIKTPPMRVILNYKQFCDEIPNPGLTEEESYFVYCYIYGGNKWELVARVNELGQMITLKVVRVDGVKAVLKSDLTPEKIDKELRKIVTVGGATNSEEEPVPYEKLESDDSLLEDLMPTLYAQRSKPVSVGKWFIILRAVRKENITSFAQFNREYHRLTQLSSHEKFVTYILLYSGRKWKVCLDKTKKGDVTGVYFKSRDYPEYLRDYEDVSDTEVKNTLIKIALSDRKVRAQLIEAGFQLPSEFLPQKKELPDHLSHWKDRLENTKHRRLSMSRFNVIFPDVGRLSEADRLQLFEYYHGDQDWEVAIQANDGALHIKEAKFRVQRSTMRAPQLDYATIDNTDVLDESTLMSLQHLSARPKVIAELIASWCISKKENINTFAQFQNAYSLLPAAKLFDRFLVFVSIYKNYKWKTLIEKGIDQKVRLKLSLRHMKIDSQPFARTFKPENLYWLENRESQSEMIEALKDNGFSIPIRYFITNGKQVERLPSHLDEWSSKLTNLSLNRIKTFDDFSEAVSGLKELPLNEQVLLYVYYRDFQEWELALEYAVDEPAQAEDIYTTVVKKRQRIPTTSSGSNEGGGGKVKKGFVDKADMFLKRNRKTINKSPGIARNRRSYHVHSEDTETGATSNQMGRSMGRTEVSYRGLLGIFFNHFNCNSLS